MRLGFIVTWQGRPTSWRSAGRLVPSVAYKAPSVTLFQDRKAANEAIRQTLAEWERMLPAGSSRSGLGDFLVIPVTR